MSEPDFVEQTDVVEQEQQVIPENQVGDIVNFEAEVSDNLGFESDKISKREEKQESQDKKKQQNI